MKDRTKTTIAPDDPRVIQIAQLIAALLALGTAPNARAAELARERAALGVAERAQGRADEEEEVGAGERARRLVEDEGEHHEEPGDGGEPERRAGPLAGAQDGEMLHTLHVRARGVGGGSIRTG